MEPTTPSRKDASSYEHPMFSKITSIPPFTTPMNKGTASQVRYDTETTREFVDPYIMQDLKTHKVYVPFSVFLHVVFDLPTDWEKNPDVIRGVEAIENSTEYQQSLGDYLKLCETERNERKLYHGHVATRNYAALAVANADGTDTGLSVHTYRQDARDLLGIPASRSPDLCSVLKIVFDDSGNDMKRTNESGPAKDKRFAVAHINHWNDVKADTHLLDGGVGAYVVMEKRERSPLSDVLDSLLIQLILSSRWHVPRPKAPEEHSLCA